ATGRRMSTRTLLIAHRTAAVRDRFAVALADARHDFVMAASEAEAVHLTQDARQPLNLALVDLGLSAAPLDFVRTLRQRPDMPLPVVAFAGTIASTADVPALAALGVAYINEYAATPQIL